MPIESIVAQIEPAQDLHGQDAPYPPGGGLNKFPVGSFNKATDGGVTVNLTSATLNGYEATKFTVSGTASAWGWRIYQRGIRDILQPETSYRVTFVANASIIFLVNVCSVSSAHSLISQKTFTAESIGGGLYRYSADITTLAETNNNWNYSDQVLMFFTNPATLSDIEFTIINDICLTLGTDPTGWYPYSNECPISGWTGLEGQRTGVNVWDEVTEVGGINDDTGLNSSASDRIRSKNFISVAPDTSYCLHYGGTNYSWNVIAYMYDVNKVYLGNTTATRITSRAETTVFTTTSKTHYVRFQVHPSYGTTYNHDISINYPSTDTEYHAYTGESLSVSWQDTAGTVYGGTLDVTNGVLTVDRAMVDLGTLTWIQNAIYSSIYYATVSGIKQPTISSERNKGIISSIYKPSVSTALNNNMDDFGMLKNGSAINIKNTNCSTVEEFVTASSGQTLVYELSTPITYQLTAEQMDTLLGTNNIWVDTGDVTVTYQSTTSRSEYIVGMIGRPIEVFDENTEDEDVRIVTDEVIRLLPAVIEDILLEVPLQVTECDPEDYPSGDGWQILTEEAYQKSREEEIDPRLAILKNYKQDKQ